MFYGNLAQLGKKSNSVIRFRSVMVKNWCNVLSKEGVTVCGHHPECRVSFGRGGPHIVWWDPRTDHRTSLETISNVPWHTPAREAYWKVASHRPKNKTFIIGASPGVSDKLWNKNAIGGRRWDVATQERKVCNMEIEIVTFVVKGYEVDRPYRLTGANPSRKQECCSPSCLWSQAQGDTSDRDNSQSLGY